MRVYRCIKLQEVINKYKNESSKKIENDNLNTHKYNKNQEYIHFFKYYDFAKYYFELGKDGSYDNKNNNYILFMVANIPNEILEKYKGFGFYSLGNEEMIIPEYAIPINEFNPNFIVDITDKPIGFYSRLNEKNEYEKYLEIVRRLKTTKDIKNIVPDLEKLIDLGIDNRSELEINEDINNQLLNINFQNFDDEIEELKTRNKWGI